MSRVDLLLDAIGEIRDDFILDAKSEAKSAEETAESAEAAGRVSKAEKSRHQRVWRKMVIAAMFGILFVGAVVLIRRQGTGNGSENKVQEWTSDFEAKDYFINSAKGDGNEALSTDKSALLAPYATGRYFTDERERLEQEGVIPRMETHPLFDAVAYYNKDGSLYSVELAWHRRGEKNEYSDLSIKAGNQEIEEIECCIMIEVDDRGNIVTPQVTVTEREGIQIIAEGRENRDKTITFQTEQGWYQISGSWNDSYETVVALFEWFWANPLKPEQFMEGGDVYEYQGDIKEYPECLEPYIPDIAALGYALQGETVGWKNGVPISYSGNYGSEESGYLSWYLNAEPDYYEQQAALGGLKELTKEQVLTAFGEDGSRGFFWDEFYIAIYLGAGTDATDAWEIIELLQEMAK